MGSYRLLLIAAPLLLALPARAQEAAQQDDPIVNLPSPTRPPSSNPSRQGPELDVFRDPVPGTIAPATPPPLVVTPTITPPPPPRQTRAAPPPGEATRQPDRTSPPPLAQGASRPVREQQPQAVQETPPAQPEPAASIQPQPQPVVPDADNAAGSAATFPETRAAAESGGGTPWGWIVAGLALIVAMGGFLILRRRQVENGPTYAPEPVAPASPPAGDPYTPVPDPQADPAPVPPPASKPVVEPAIAPVSEPVTIRDGDRPWIDMQLEIAQARFSLVGVTISYSLVLHNRGERPAQDVLVRGVLGNAGPQQQAVLDAFFTGQTGMPLHSAVAIAPGETQRLSGELRLSPDEIAPVQMGERNLLIPIAAFDAAYRWGMEEAADPHGHGRTARAFIVGQDQEPLADRLAPLRVDQGFRQYRRPAARAAAELTPS